MTDKTKMKSRSDDWALLFYSKRQQQQLKTWSYSIHVQLQNEIEDVLFHLSTKQQQNRRRALPVFYNNTNQRREALLFYSSIKQESKTMLFHSSQNENKNRSIVFYSSKNENEDVSSSILFYYIHLKRNEDVNFFYSIHQQRNDSKDEKLFYFDSPIKRKHEMKTVFFYSPKNENGNKNQNVKLFFYSPKTKLKTGTEDVKLFYSPIQTKTGTEDGALLFFRKRKSNSQRTTAWSYSYLSTKQKQESRPETLLFIYILLKDVMRFASSTKEQEVKTWALLFPYKTKTTRTEEAMLFYSSRNKN